MWSLWHIEDKHSNQTFIDSRHCIKVLAEERCLHLKAKNYLLQLLAFNRDLEGMRKGKKKYATKRQSIRTTYRYDTDVGTMWQGIKINIINILMVLMKKVDSIQDQMVYFSRETKTIRKKWNWNAGNEKYNNGDKECLRLFHQKTQTDEARISKLEGRST